MSETKIVDTNYAQRAREHHKRMLSHLQISSGPLPLYNASAAAPAAVVPLTPIDDKTHSSTSSSLDSDLQSPPPSVTDFASMFGGNRPLDGQVYEPSFTSNAMQLDNHVPGKDMASDLYSFQPGLAYGHLYDTQSMPNVTNTPRLQQKSEPTYGLSNGVSTQASNYDPMMNPYGLTLNYCQPSQLSYSNPPYSMQHPTSGINPEYLSTSRRQHSQQGMENDQDAAGEDEDIGDIPASPLRSISGSESPLPSFDSFGGHGIKSRLRRTSEPSFADCDGERTRKHRRKMTWTPGMTNEGPNVPQDQKEKELAELVRLEQGGTATRRERRRLQNRLAQRAFRARSKVQNAEAATHLTDLEQLANMQADQLHKMNEALEKLQRENNALKAESWAKANAERAHYNKGAGP